MTLVATAGAADADAYLSVTDADAMAAEDLSSDPEVEAWLAAPDLATKEQALRRATSQVNASVGSGWLPYAPVAQAASGLVFPRSIDAVGGSPFIPRNVKLAVFEQAKYLIVNARRLARARARQAQDLSSASEPDVSWSRSDDAGSSEISPAAEVYLASFVQATGGRGLRSVRLGGRMPDAGL